MNKVLIVVNIPKFFVSHWLGIALAAKTAGYQVHIATMAGPEVAQIRDAGLVHHEIPMSRSGTNIWQELKSLWAIFCLFRRLQPDLVHLITIKPVIYGGIAARLAGVKAVLSAVTGLGYVFINQQKSTSGLKRLISALYTFVFGHPNIKVLFENDSDCQSFCQSEIVKPQHTVVVHGAGVDLTQFHYVPEPVGKIRIVFAARLLIDKGVMEFLAAAELLKDLSDVEFILAGDIDPENPASLSLQQLESIKRDGTVRVYGFCEDMAALFRQSHVIVLPSYREGLPKVLIEAAACGRPVVTSDVAGCRHVVIPNSSGLLVPVKDSNAIAQAIQRFVNDKDLRTQFGLAGRALAEQRFGEEQIGITYMQLYQQLITGAGQHA